MTDHADLIIVFGTASIAEHWSDALAEIAQSYQHARVVGCSSAAGIVGEQVLDNQLVGMAYHFEHTQLSFARVSCSDGDSAAAAQKLSEQIPRDNLSYVLLLSDGLVVNGSELASTLQDALPPEVLVTGGLAGDDDHFTQTYVVTGSEAEQQVVTAIGFHSERLRVGYGSVGGWDPFGPTRRVTRAEGNKLYELDNQSALGLYKRYLGEHSSGLPATGLRFPLSVWGEDQSTEVVRTLLGVDEDEQSMTFAGTIPEGSNAKLMRANFDRLIDGAAAAAADSRQTLQLDQAQAALLISCVGRKIVLGERIEEEVEATLDHLGDDAGILGFYSYGEISPLASGRCELHNQTMTITALAEI